MSDKNYMETCIEIDHQVSHLNELIETFHHRVPHPREMRTAAERIVRDARRIAELLRHRADLCERGEGEMP